MHPKLSMVLSLEGTQYMFIENQIDCNFLPTILKFLKRKFIKEKNF
jgi:hypothetical protein